MRIPTAMSTRPTSASSRAVSPVFCRPRPLSPRVRLPGSHPGRGGGNDRHRGSVRLSELRDRAVDSIRAGPAAGLRSWQRPTTLADWWAGGGRREDRAVDSECAGRFRFDTGLGAGPRGQRSQDRCGFTGPRARHGESLLKSTPS